MTRYDPRWVANFYDNYGDDEWHRWEKSPADEAKLHIHRFYLEQYVKRGDQVLEVGAGAGRFTQILAELGAGVMGVPPEENARIIRTGDLHPETYHACEHRCHMFRAEELRSLLEDNGATVVAMSASNCLSAAWGERLADVRSDPVRWQELLGLEVEACREPGCLDSGTHVIAVARKSQGISD